MEVTDQLLRWFPADTYISFLLSRPLWEVWSLFLLGLARLVPIIALTPFLGGKVLPDPMKLGLAVAVIPIFLPYIIAHSTVPLTWDFNFILLLVKEVVIGSILGFLISIPFFIVQASGTLIDHQRGSQSLQVTDPSSQAQSSPIGLLYNDMLLVLFFFINGPLLFFDAIFTSYQVIPPDQFLNPTFFSMTNPLFHTALKLTTTFLTIALQLAAPSLIALLLSDLFLGIANRMAPQVQISFLLWSLKAYVGIALLWAGWWFILKEMEAHTFDWLKMIQKLIERMA